MRISFSTGTFYHRGLGYSLGLAREIGYDGVELALGPEYTLRGVDYLVRTLQRFGVRALSVHPPFRGLPGWPVRATQVIPLLTTISRQVNAELAVVHTPVLSHEKSPRAERYSLGLRLGQEAVGGAVRLGLESNQYNLRPRRFLLDDLAALTRFAQERNCLVTFDTCHAGANGEDILACYEIVRPVLGNIHLSDVRFGRGRPYTHVMPGEGSLPLDRFLAALARDGYDGLVTVEVRPEEVGWFGRERHVRRMRQALDYVRAAIGQNVETPVSRS
ncbi:MAG TPA: sugar phosphate isomerase/epimerase [Ktedonobacterales bacterium]